MTSEMLIATARHMSHVRAMCQFSHWHKSHHVTAAENNILKQSFFDNQDLIHVHIFFLFISRMIVLILYFYQRSNIHCSRFWFLVNVMFEINAEMAFIESMKTSQQAFFFRN